MYFTFIYEGPNDDICLSNLVVLMNDLSFDETRESRGNSVYREMVF